MRSTFVQICIALLLCAPLSFLPAQVFGQVVINEVMYNPQGSDTGREWLELYNEGASDVAMVGSSGKGSWRINDGSNHTLTDPQSGTGRGSLTIPAGGYLIIANDPTDFISGEYTGGSYSVVKSSISLNNNGATLTLLDGTGATVDTVAYTPSQGGNDDSSSLQRQADGSWIAALPTPGADNSATPYVAPVVDDGPNDTSQSQSASNSDSSSTLVAQTAPSTSYVPPPAPSLYADAGGDQTVIVGADVEFDGSAYDRTQTLIDPTTVRFLWNFGDGSIAEGASVLHHFSYPGRYAVTLDIGDNRNAADDLVTVTAQPAALVFALQSDGGVSIENLAGHDLDLSQWIVREDAGTFSDQFILPQGSKVLDGSSMQISPETLTFRASSSTTLEYPNGMFALAIGQSSATSTADTDTPVTVPQSPPEATLAAASAPVAVAPEPQPEPDTTDDDMLDASDTEDAPIALQPTSTVVEDMPAAPPHQNYLWWVGAGALALAVFAAIAAALQFKKGEWDIVEDTSE